MTRRNNEFDSLMLISFRLLLTAAARVGLVFIRYEAQLRKFFISFKSSSILEIFNFLYFKQFQQFQEL